MESLPFAEWPIRAELRLVLDDQGLVNPTAVQSASFERVRAGGDMLVRSGTGTGKTLAFGLPLLDRLADDATPSRGPSVLVVLPTRELAIQVGTVLGKYGRAVRREVATLFGGGSYRDQLRALQHGARVVVGTPGRLCDHLERGSLDLKNCHTLVLDEADEILDLGFAEELDKLLTALPADRQTLLFSATLTDETKRLAAKTLRDPETLALGGESQPAPEIKHVAFSVFPDQKTEALVNVLHVERPTLAILFCHTKAETESLAARLAEEGFSAAYLNGDMAQAERTRTLNAFRRGRLDLLVATDVAARGIDVKGVSHVINLGVPRDPATYVHRVGRTGRAGASGRAITFVPGRDAMRFKKMLANAGVALDMQPLPQAADVRKRLREVLHEGLHTRTAAGADPEFMALAQELLAYHEPLDLVAALLAGDETAQAAMIAGRDVPVPSSPVKAPRMDGPPRPMASGDRGPMAGPPGERPAFEPRTGREPRDGREPRKLREHHEPGMQRIWLNQGKMDQLAPGRLVQLLCSAGGLTSQQIGAIAIHTHFCFFDVSESEANRVVTTLNNINQRGRPFKANLVPATEG